MSIHFPFQCICVIYRIFLCIQCCRNASRRILKCIAKHAWDNSDYDIVDIHTLLDNLGIWAFCKRCMCVFCYIQNRTTNRRIHRTLHCTSSIQRCRIPLFDIRSCDLYMFALDKFRTRTCMHRIAWTRSRRHCIMYSCYIRKFCMLVCGIACISSRMHCITLFRSKNMIQCHQTL